MKPTNLISAFQGLKAFNECKDSEQKVVAPYKISDNEATVLGSFCDLLNKYDCPFDVFDGYYIGYSINQISKEFDLLRFSEDLVINIELKQELNLSVDEKIEKVLKQQSKNFYYLKVLQKSVFICTYVENDGLYKYDNLLNKTRKISCEELIDILKNQNFDINIDPDKLFIPSNYLVSPFNSTERFLDGEYFLTGSQEEIKNELLKKITSDYVMYCITYTSSQYSRESIDVLSSLSDFKAHDVIGQEFKKVVFVMDDNFRYDDSGKLQYRKCYYSLPGMFYQIITRVINEMKIIVFNNKSLYYKLLQIKSLDKNNE